jgi:hypothetical protein
MQRDSTDWLDENKMAAKMSLLAEHGSRSGAAAMAGPRFFGDEGEGKLRPFNVQPACTGPAN